MLDDLKDSSQFENNQHRKNFLKAELIRDTRIARHFLDLGKFKMMEGSNKEVTDEEISEILLKMEV